MTEHRIRLPQDRPPLDANQRHHWAAKARITRELRREVAWLVKAESVGHHDHVTVGMEWRPAVRRRRDAAENVAPTLKVCVDAVVDAGVVVDDVPEHVTRTMPVLLDPDRETAGVWLVVTTP